jgi:hypothetical protein
MHAPTDPRTRTLNSFAADPPPDPLVMAAPAEPGGPAVLAIRPHAGDAPLPRRRRARPPDDDLRHALPLPVTFDLLGELRRRMPLPVAETLFSIFDELICRTVLHDAGEPDGSLARRVEGWVRLYARLRREWVDMAHEAVGDEGMTPLRVVALAHARAGALRSRVSEGTRRDLEAALGDAGRALSAFAVLQRTGPTPDLARLRVLSTRFDLCVATALLAETDPLFVGASLASPLLCAEARVAATRIRDLVEPGRAAGRAPGRATARATRRPRAPRAAVTPAGRGAAPAPDGAS